MHRVAVIGAGYVGLTTAACLAHLGQDVCCSDSDPARVRTLAAAGIPFMEAGLKELVTEGLRSGRLVFGSDNVAAVRGAEFVFVCVPTPPQADGRADTSVVEGVALEVGPHLEPDAVVVNKSTAPVGATRLIERAIRRGDVRVVSNPEFLREGSAVHDFLHPDRIVIGADDEATAIRVSALFMRIGAPLVVADPATAEAIKYASNAFLAVKVSFVNAIANLCEVIGADVRQVVLGMGYDPRVGAAFLRPGPGWGGTCFPKDVAALVRMADDAGYDFSLLKGAIAVNAAQMERVVEKAARLAGGNLAGARVGLWGLTFKAGTDDLRESPAIRIAGLLRERGAAVAAYDPTVSASIAGIEVAPDPYRAGAGASVLVLATEWDEFRWVDLERLGAQMARRAIVDARNVLDPAAVRRAGFVYEGIGVR